MSSADPRCWLTSFARLWSHHHSIRAMRSRRSRRTWLEVCQLEDRRVLSTLLSLASFNTVNGGSPSGPVVVDSNGNLFGTTAGVGGNGNGTVFELPNGSNTITTLASFTTGDYPSGGLVEDSNGNLFGTTLYGGVNNYGTVFELAQGSSSITTLAAFYTGNSSDGMHPNGRLVEDSSGNLFGTTGAGGANNLGAVWELAKGSNTITILASFNGSNGSNPYAGLIVDSSGNLFGTTNSGGANNLGTVWELAQGSSTITTLASFTGGNGANPFGGLIKDSGGNLFGTTAAGGASGDGVLFMLAQGSNTITPLAFFNGTNGANPSAGLVEDSSGNFFGITTSGGANADGTVFELPQGSSTIVAIVSFNGSNGSNPSSGLVQDSTGNLFGVTTSGGASSFGTIFELNQAIPSIITQPQNGAATVGQTNSVSFIVGTSGGRVPLTAQWEISTDNGVSFSNLSNGSGVTGATTMTLTLSSFAAAGSAEYRAVITDANSVTATSNAATLIINAAPAVTAQPQNATVTAGQTSPASFSIAVTGGTGTLAVQWQISTDNGTSFTDLSDGNGVTGSATTTLTVSGFTSAGSVEYRALVTDANGVTALSSSATLTVNPTPNERWLTQVYADFFNRPLDASGLATWSNLLNQGFSRMQVVQLIQSGLEYRLDVVEALYSKLLQRAGDQAGLNGFTSFLGSGGTFEQVEAAILGSQEYFQLHGGTNDSFLNAVYLDVLNRPVDASGAQSWGLRLGTGSMTTAVAGAILASAEAATDAVQGFYMEFLRRVADPSGLNSFSTALQQGLPSEGAIASIVASDEYFARAQ